MIERKIKNQIVFTTIILGFFLHSIAGGMVNGAANEVVGATDRIACILTGGVIGLAQATAGCLIPLILLPLYCMRFFGAGDIKLLMASGACLGLSASIHTILWTLLVEGAIGFFVLYWHRVVNKRTTFVRFPMAPFHMVGVLLTLFGPELVVVLV